LLGQVKDLVGESLRAVLSREHGCLARVAYGVFTTTLRGRPFRAGDFEVSIPQNCQPFVGALAIELAAAVRVLYTVSLTRYAIADRPTAGAETGTCIADGGVASTAKGTRSGCVKKMAEGPRTQSGPTGHQRFTTAHFGRFQFFHSFSVTAGRECACPWAQQRTTFEACRFIYPRQLKLSMGKFIEEPALVPETPPIIHLLSSISHPSCILYIESSESFSCILDIECSESWTAASLAPMVDT